MFRHPTLLILAAFLFVSTACAPVAPAPEQPPQPTEPVVTLPVEVTPAPIISPEPPVQEPVEQAAVPARVAYTGQDGNLWVVSLEGGQARALTNDALPFNSSGQPLLISYQNPRWSTDGAFLAYQREVGQAHQEGYNFRTELWVYETASDQAKPVIGDLRVAGYAWRPGTHQLVFGLPLAEGYLFNRGQAPDASLATGIWAVDVNGGEPFELVRPERGLSLVAPRFSPDGSILSFDEVYLIEGRGNFAFYNFNTGTYTTWDQPVGNYDMDSSGQTLVFDRMVYTPNGEERIWKGSVQPGEAVNLTPHIQNGYAFTPVLSPQADRLAYFEETLDIPDSSTPTLVVLDPAGGEPVRLGRFEQVQNLEWSPAGDELIFSTGPYGDQRVVAVSATTGEVRTLSNGSFPTVCCRAP